MREDISRVAAVLCAGRTPRELIAPIAAAFALAAVFWVTACLFMVLEP